MTMKNVLIICFVFLFQTFFGQLREGDIAKITLKMNDTSNVERLIVFPNGEFTLVYNVARELSKVVGYTHNPDSVKLLESILPSIMKQYNIKKLKIIWQASNSESSYYYWLSNIKKSKIFNKSTNYDVEYYSTNERFELTGFDHKVSLVNPEGLILSSSKSILGLGKEKEKMKGRTIKAKLLTEKLGVKKPLINTTIYIMEGTAVDEALAEAKTDKYGDFEIVVPEKKMDYKLKAMPEGQVDNVILSTQSGKEISRFTKTALGFDYKLLEVDIVRLSSLEQEDDIASKFKQLINKNSNEINITENINYVSSSFDLDKNAKAVLDKVVVILKENPKVKIEIISHTDAQGDDNSNLVLSQKRSISVLNYLVVKGIDKARIKATGKGESVIRNRCINGVDCSDKEHEFNRRTEFSFTK